MLPLLPAALVALFAAWSGNLWDGAAFPAAAVGQLALLLVAALGSGEMADPWRLGRRWAWLPWLLWLVLIVSLLASPVPRAGRVAAALFPAFVLLPAAVARCLTSERARQRGVVAIAIAATAIAAWGWGEVLLGDALRAARPLGHHLALAAWSVTLLPIALLPLGWPGVRRLLGLESGLLIGGAVAASGSLLGLAAAGVQACLAAASSRRAWRLVLGVGLLALAFAVPRLERIARGEDGSAQARLAYARGGLEGIAERPWLGWGPGATPWTLAAFLPPSPGVRPAGESVGDLHSLPLALAYELGLPGLALALLAGARFGWVRFAERRQTREKRLLIASLLALAGAALVAFGFAALALLALPVAAAVAAGFALAASPRPPRPLAGGRLAYGAYLIGALALLAPAALAQRESQLASQAAGWAAQAPHLERAVDWDPHFPLYRARLSWVERALGRPAHEEARLAAEEAWGVAPLWLAAGVMAKEAGAPWALEALARACELDPRGPMAPIQAVLAAPDSPEAPRRAARALAAESRLAAATLFAERPQLRRAALEHYAAEGGIDAGLRAALVERAAALDPGAPPLADIGLVMDGKASSATSLYLFRRRPWEIQLTAVVLSAPALAQLNLPSAAERPETSPAVFDRSGCRP